MAAQASVLHLDVEETHQAEPSETAGQRRLRMTWFFQGMGLGALMLIGVAAISSSQKHSGHDTALAFIPVVAGARAFQVPGRFQAAKRSSVAGVDMSASQSDMPSTRSRRDFVTAGVLAGGAALNVQPAGAAATGLAPCPKDAENCWSTASTDKTKMTKWIWPFGMSRTDAIASLRGVLEAYPQAGQDKVDLGGWAFAVDELATSGSARLEFKSGIGNFAKFMNGGKPFVDDFEVLVEETGVCVRSSSRAGASDFGVNAKRVNYIAAALRAKGWLATGVTPGRFMKLSYLNRS